MRKRIKILLLVHVVDLAAGCDCIIHVSKKAIISIIITLDVKVSKRNSRFNDLFIEHKPMSSRMFGVTTLHAQIAIIHVRRTLVRREARYLTRLTHYTCRNPLYVRSISVKLLVFNRFIYYRIFQNRHRASFNHESFTDNFFLTRTLKS